MNYQIRPSEPRTADFGHSRETAVIAFFASAVDALKYANDVAGWNAYSWRIVSETEMAVQASCGILVQADNSFSSERKSLLHTTKPRMVTVCADTNVESYVGKTLDAWLKECRNRGLTIGSLGTGTYLLARPGLLADKHCTIHWEMMASFSERFTWVVANAHIYHVEDNRWTCAGGAAAFDLMLHMVERDLGEEIAAGISERTLVERGRKSSER